MADWNADVSVDALYLDLLVRLAARDVDAVTLGVASYTNPPVGAIEYNRAGLKFREWSGAAYVDVVLSLAGGGTGAVTAAGVRTNLGLGDMALQSSAAVNISGGTIAGNGSGLTNLNAAALSTNLVPSARLGTGGAGAGAKFLADDQTFKTISTNLRDQTVVVAAVQTADFTPDFTKDTYPLSGSHTVNLPTVVGNGGKRVSFVYRGTGTWTFTCNGAETLLGIVSQLLDFPQYSSFTLEADANSGLWDIL